MPMLVVLYDVRYVFEKTGCPVSNFSARFFRKTIDRVKICAPAEQTIFSNLSFLLFSLLCYLLLQFCP